jgi:uncharacterized protein YndB with AHSA1/START domain
MDIPEQINATYREVRGRAVLVKRGYVAEIEDVWDACTDPERLGRWFLPVTGDLRLGGHYQLEGNAHGEILRCAPPELLRISWIFGESGASYVEVRLAAIEGGTMFELEHSGLDDDQHWNQFGPGAVGVGWDLTVLGLGLHLAGLVNPQGWGTSSEAYEFMTASAVAWGAAHEKAGEDPAQAVAAAERTASFYVPQQS